ncbi:PUA-like domain-containing protein [Hysterangium stoloniferum]|nr:PUA-like domain-containing protein [Hysterangium stoloniferum]
MKAEPDSRIVKGKDVKFSVDDFEATGTTAWEGVRNHEAKNIMKGMNLGDKVLFYHSNTKSPGIAGFAEVSKEAYPDHTAWDKRREHPYFDPKTDPNLPKWFMVDLRFASRASHFVSLALLRHISTLSKPPSTMGYLEVEDLKAIKDMALLNKGRLSVQRVTKEEWDVVEKIAEEGYEGLNLRAATKEKGAHKAKTEGHDGHANQGENNNTSKRKPKIGQSEGTRNTSPSESSGSDLQGKHMVLLL